MASKIKGRIRNPQRTKEAQNFLKILRDLPLILLIDRLHVCRVEDVAERALVLQGHDVVGEDLATFDAYLVHLAEGQHGQGAKAAGLDSTEGAGSGARDWRGHAGADDGAAGAGWYKSG